MDGRRERMPLPLSGWTVSVSPDATKPVAICAQHMWLLGATRRRDDDDSSQVALTPPRAEPAVRCTIPWSTPDASREWNESMVQAASGLMAVHAGERGSPRRLGLDVASVAAGTLAAQGLLAARFARARGTDVQGVSSSVLQGALTYLYHHIAIGTSGGRFPFEALRDGLGPPFPTADGQLIELEALGGDTWLKFWRTLGVDAAIASSAWLPFVYRYLAGRCSLPIALHEATKRHTVDALVGMATATGLAACRVRGHAEVPLRDYERRPWTFRSWKGEATPTLGDARGSVSEPLRGVRVVEITSRLQGPLAGQLLRLLGADVTKVEPPNGDFGRSSPPLAGSVGAAYLAYNRRKRVEELDYTVPADKARLLELIADCDVFLHNWPKGRAERLGLDFEALSKTNTRLIHAHASGWGRAIEEPTRIAGDQLVQAHAGCGDVVSSTDNGTAPSRLTIVDTMGGLLACEGILATLCARENDGHGRAVETSLMGAALALRRATPRHRWTELDRPFATAQGHLIVRACTPTQRASLSRVCGVRTRSRVSVKREMIARCLATRAAAEWVAPLDDAGITAVVVRENASDVPDRWKESGLTERANDACWVPAAPWTFSP